MSWKDAVEAAARRIAAKSADGVFSRQDLLAEEQTRIVAESGGGGETPEQTISRCLQELRADGVLDFLDDQGTYRLIH